jgi:hypothetical protein
MGVLKVILYILLFYYAFKFIMRLLLPVMVQKTVQHMEETIRNQSQQYQQHNRAPEQPKEKYPRETKKVGEYVDFEEID